MNDCGQEAVLRPQEVALTRATQKSQNEKRKKSFTTCSPIFVVGLFTERPPAVQRSKYIRLHLLHRLHRGRRFLHTQPLHRCHHRQFQHVEKEGKNCSDLINKVNEFGPTEVIPSELDHVSMPINFLT